MDRAEEKPIAREAYIAAVEAGERDHDKAFFFRGLDRAKVKMVRRRLHSATQVAEAAPMRGFFANLTSKSRGRYMTFTPGQSVAFVDNTNLGTLGYGDEVYPTLGETYTVRDVVIDHFGAEGLLLNEIRNDRLPYRVGAQIVDFEKPFASWRFRPLVSGEKLKEREAV